MRSLNLHLKVLIAILLTLSVAITAYQISVQGIPVTGTETDDLRSIGAKIDSVTTSKIPVRVQMFIPPLSQNYVSLNGSLVSSNYGVSINRADGNRKVTWSAHRANGRQTPYCRLVLTRCYIGEKAKEKGPVFRDSLLLEGLEKIAARALLAPIHQHSAGVETFVSEAARCANNDSGDDVKPLMAGDTSLEKRAHIVKTLLSIAHAPMGRVRIVRLVADPQQSPEPWLRSFNGENWLYFNVATGEQDLPSNCLIWWLDDRPLITIDGGRKAQVSFSLNSSEMNAIRLAKLSDENTKATFLEYSLYGLLLLTQQASQIMIMIPTGMLAILILRNLIGLQILNTFTPVLIALVFRKTGLQWGIILFATITALGPSLRSYLKHLKLQMLSRLSMALTFVVVMIAVISLFSHKLSFESGLSIVLFPMVILAMTIERLSITWEECGDGHTIKVAIGTLSAASLVHTPMRILELVYLIFTSPAVLLILAAFMLVMGRYRSYRPTELFRFKALLKD